MTAKIINLKQARKQRQRDEKEKSAAAARQKFGRTKAEKQRDKRTGEKATAHLDGHKLTDDNNE